jgi:uncharacterized SAM-binding protein YcdF (DUF218 family)
MDRIPPADAIILLGGSLSPPSTQNTTENLGEAADRIVHALRLYRQKKAHFIVVSGGNLPWQDAALPEGSLVANLLMELGVPPSAIVLELDSRNTLENATNTAAIFAARGWKTGLLVTSGLHMPRALATFEKVDLEVTAAATDIRAQYPTNSDLLDLLPDASALSQTTFCVKEFLGRFVYRLRGWL